MPVRCVSVALNSAMNKAHFISIGRTLLAIIFVMLDERGRERAILVCVCMSLTCADTAALLLVPETLTCELCVLKITG